eukprot:13774776-Heterocapsa_arctica.AAC.1
MNINENQKICLQKFESQSVGYLARALREKEKNLHDEWADHLEEQAWAYHCHANSASAATYCGGCLVASEE